MHPSHNTRTKLQTHLTLTPPHPPQYILPRMPRTMSKPTGAGGSAGAAPGSERSVTVVVKSLRNPPLDLRLTSQPLHTSVLDLKGVVAAETGVAPDKIRLLFRKKPAVDSKALSDLLEGGSGEAGGGGNSSNTIEFSVMIMGGAASLPKGDAAAKGDVAQGVSGREVLETSKFWDDLKGFLLQRIRDEKDSEELFNAFQTAWKSTR
jgi:ubiquitin-like protein 4